MARIDLSQLGWGMEHESALKRCKVALINSVRLGTWTRSRSSVCSPTLVLNIVAHIPPADRGRPIEYQAHHPLMFLSGTFTGVAERWAIIEKEAFTLVETVKRADYKPGAFHLFTDHKNLRYIFNPDSVVSEVPKYTADKLQRWSLLLMGNGYIIVHLPGEKNVWTDLLSRHLRDEAGAVSNVRSVGPRVLWPDKK